MNKLFALPILLFAACSGSVDEDLPIYGQHEYKEIEVDGKTIRDTTFYSIPDFKLHDQDSNIVSIKTVEGKVYVADFFFTSCPTICPKMKRNMYDLYETFEENDDLLFLSHSIDPKRDSVLKLRTYAESLGVESDRWHFMTGEKDEIYDLAKAYMISAAEDPRAPGGYIHSGAFILIDQKGRIRGYYDGTLPEDTETLKNDIKKLLASS